MQSCACRSNQLSSGLLLHQLWIGLAMAMPGQKGKPTNLHPTSVGVLFSEQAGQAGLRDILDDLRGSLPSGSSAEMA